MTTSVLPGAAPAEPDPTAKNPKSILLEVADKLDAYRRLAIATRIGVAGAQFVNTPEREALVELQWIMADRLDEVRTLIENVRLQVE